MCGFPSVVRGYVRQPQVTKAFTSTITYAIGISHPFFHRNTIRPCFAVYFPFISSYHKMLSKDWMLDSLGLYPNLLPDAGKGRYKGQHRMKIRNLLNKKPLTTAAVDSEEKWDVGIGLKRETKQFYMIQLWDWYVKRFQCTVTHILIMVNCRSCLCVSRYICSYIRGCIDAAGPVWMTWQFTIERFSKDLIENTLTFEALVPTFPSAFSLRPKWLTVIGVKCGVKEGLSSKWKIGDGSAKQTGIVLSGCERQWGRLYFGWWVDMLIQLRSRRVWYND